MTSQTLIISGIAVFFIVIIWAIATINGFRSKEIKVTEALSGIEVALTKRYDLLTKLLDTSKGFMAHEKEVFTNIVQLRKGMNAGEMNDVTRHNEEISAKFFAVAENYPELRSSDIFIELQRGIKDTEEHLQAARRLYNANATSYNTAIVMFPASLLAQGRQAKEFFEAEDYKKADVTMKF